MASGERVCPCRSLSAVPAFSDSWQMTSGSRTRARPSPAGIGQKYLLGKREESGANQGTPSWTNIKIPGVGESWK